MRLVRLALCCLGLAATLATSGCGGDSKAACDKIQAEIQNVSTAGMKQISDPQAVEKTYQDGAAKIRAEGKTAGGDVEAAANDVAAALEDLGKQVGARSTKAPDQAPLTNAGIKLKAACS